MYWLERNGEVCSIDDEHMRDSPRTEAATAVPVPVLSCLGQAAAGPAARARGQGLGLRQLCHEGEEESRGRTTADLRRAQELARELTQVLARCEHAVVGGGDGAHEKRS